MSQNNSFAKFNLTNTSTFDQLEEEPYIVGINSYIANFITCLLTVVFNSAVLNCLRTHWKKIPEVISHQTLCISVTDLIAGFFPLLICLHLVEAVNRSEHACVMTFSMYNASQVAVILNLCVLSFRRWYVLRNVSKPSYRPTQSIMTSVLYISGPWTVSLLVHGTQILVRFILYQATVVNGCFSKKMYENLKRNFIVVGIYAGIVGALSLFSIHSMISLKRLAKSNNIQSRNQHSQSKAFKHLLVVLLTTGVTSLPLVVMFILLFTTLQEEIKKYFYLTIHFQALNSLVNPLVYCLQIKEIRSAMKENFNSVFLAFGQVKPKEQHAEISTTAESVSKDILIAEVTQTVSQETQHVKRQTTCRDLL